MDLLYPQFFFVIMWPEKSVFLAIFPNRCPQTNLRCSPPDIDYKTEPCNGYPKSLSGNTKIQILTVTTFWRGFDSRNGNFIFLLFYIICQNLSPKSLQCKNSVNILRILSKNAIIKKKCNYNYSSKLVFVANLD